MELEDIKVGMKVKHVVIGDKGVIVCNIPNNRGEVLVNYLEGDLQDESWGAFPENLEEVKEETMQSKSTVSEKAYNALCTQIYKVGKQKKPHIHAEIIKAWADGATIQFSTDDGYSWLTTNSPTWDSNYQYRVKPEPKADVVYYANVYKTSLGRFHDTLSQLPRYNESLGILKFTYDGETEKLKFVEIVE